MHLHKSHISYFIIIVYISIPYVHFPIQWIFRELLYVRLLKVILLCANWVEMRMRRRKFFTKSKLNFHLDFTLILTLMMIVQEFQIRSTIGNENDVVRIFGLNFRVIWNGLFVNKGNFMWITALLMISKFLRHDAVEFFNQNYWECLIELYVGSVLQQNCHVTPSDPLKPISFKFHIKNPPKIFNTNLIPINHTQLIKSIHPSLNFLFNKNTIIRNNIKHQILYS